MDTLNYFVQDELEASIHAQEILADIQADLDQLLSASKVREILLSAL
jgi:hypothetical protein